MTKIPCGCAKCGCLCPDHSPTGAEHPCTRHVQIIVTRWIAGEAMALVALALFISSIAVVAGLQAHLTHLK